MQNISISDFNYLIFIIPGFITVWTFRFFTKIESKGEFEYAALSFVWGLILALMYGFVLKFHKGPDITIDNLSKIYGMTVAFTFIATIVGFTGACISKSQPFKKFLALLFKIVEKPWC